MYFSQVYDLGEKNEYREGNFRRIQRIENGGYTQTNRETAEKVDFDEWNWWLD